MLEMVQCRLVPVQAEAEGRKGPEPTEVATKLLVGERPEYRNVHSTKEVDRTDPGLQEDSRIRKV